MRRRRPCGRGSLKSDKGHGGFYTYQTLENMVRCRITNTTEILPAQQHPVVGDDIFLHPTAPPMRIEIVDPPNILVLFGAPADVGAEGSWGVSTWQFVVHPGRDGGSRLLTRGRYDHSPDWKSRLAFGRFPIEAISFVMSRKMMLEIETWQSATPDHDAHGIPGLLGAVRVVFDSFESLSKQ